MLTTQSGVPAGNACLRFAPNHADGQGTRGERFSPAGFQRLVVRWLYEVPLGIRGAVLRWRCLQRSAIRHPHRDARWTCLACAPSSAPLCVWHRHHVRPRHLGHFPVGGKDWRLRYPADIEARSLQTVGYEFADCCFALVNRLSWLEYRRIVRSIREDSLDVLPFRCRLGPLGIPMQELLALNPQPLDQIANENIR